MSVNIDMADPAVRRLMGEPDAGAGVVRPGGLAAGKPMMQLAGDEDRGLTHTTNLDVGKREVAVLLRPARSVTILDAILTVDVYAISGEPVKAHLICPRCKHTLTVDGHRKAIAWDPTGANPHTNELVGALPEGSAHLAYAPGVLSVETFQCTWELEDAAQDTNKDTSIIARGSLCRFRAAIDRNVIREV